MFTDNDGILTGNGQLYCNGSYCIINKDVNSSSTYNPSIGTGQQNMTSCFSTTANKENSLVGMCYTKYTIEHIPATFVGNQAMPQYTYLEFDNSHIDNTAYNGNVFTYYYQGSLYNTINLKLGNIINNDSYYYECKLVDDYNIEVGTSFVSLNVNPIDIYNDGALYIDNNQSVYVVTRNISYNKQYKLVITSYYDGGSALNEDIDWFLFLPLNSVVSGETILNFGSGDGFGLVDSTGQIIDSSEEQTNELLDNSNVANIVNDFLLTSGDSGERFVAFGYVDYDNPYTDFITRTMFDITNVLISSGNVNYTLGFHDDEHIILHSDDFYLPNGPLKVFINSAIIFFIVYKIYGKMKMYIDSIAEGDILYTLEWKDGKWNEYIFF